MFMMTDMIRATVYVDDVNDMEHVYKAIAEDTYNFKIARIKNNLDKNI